MERHSLRHAGRKETALRGRHVLLPGLGGEELAQLPEGPGPLALGLGLDLLLRRHERRPRRGVGRAPQVIDVVALLLEHHEPGDLGVHGVRDGLDELRRTPHGDVLLRLLHGLHRKSEALVVGGGPGQNPSKSELSKNTVLVLYRRPLEPDAQAHRSYAPRAGRVPELAVEKVLHVLGGRLEHHLGLYFLRFFLYVLVLMVTTGGTAPRRLVPRHSTLESGAPCLSSHLSGVAPEGSSVAGHSLSLLD